MLPKATVAVITYNQKPFLEECLASVFAQDYPDLEVVVADDASTDGTQEYLKRVQAERPGQVRLALAKRNQGITGNCNAALKLCTGEFVAWLGGDDLLLPGKVRRQVGFMLADPTVTLSYHDAELFDSDTGRALHNRNSGPGSRRPRSGDAASLVRFNSIGASTAMTRASAHPPHGYDSRVPWASDWLFSIEVAARGRFAFLPEVLGRYRVHPGQITRRREFLEDEMVTLGLVDARYPHLRRATRRRRARAFMEQGLRDLRRGSRRKGLRGVWAALRVDWLALTTVGWAARRGWRMLRRRGTGPGPGPPT